VLQVAALKNLNLNVRRAKIGQNEKGTNRHKFYITDSTTRSAMLVAEHPDTPCRPHPSPCCQSPTCACTRQAAAMLLALSGLLAWCSEKILKSRRLEEIRLTILNNLLLFHPESGQELAWGIRARKADSSIDVPLGARSKCVSCTSNSTSSGIIITCSDDSSNTFTLLAHDNRMRCSPSGCAHLVTCTTAVDHCSCGTSS
jgi:hypothetical protein